MGSALIIPLAPTQVGGVEVQPEHLAGAVAIFVSLGAAISASIFLLPVMYWIGNHADDHRSILLWILVGFAFAITSAFLTGASGPLTNVLIGTWYGVIPLENLIDQIIDSFFRAPLSSFIYGVLAFSHTLFISAPLFAVGGWIIDILNRQDHPGIYAHAAYAFALVVGGTLFLFSALGPLNIISKLALG